VTVKPRLALRPSKPVRSALKSRSENYTELLNGLSQTY